MDKLLQGAGPFIWPLGFCSFLAVFIIVERLFALRGQRVLTDALMAAIVAGKPEAAAEADRHTAGGRIVNFWAGHRGDPEALKAYAKLELTRLERGLFILDTIVGVAPLLGLLGTVYGLFILFPDDGSKPDTATMMRGVGLGLTSTMIGLFIAIPALAGSNYLGRRLELISARINLAVEKLSALKRDDESRV
jgi:biopolymer transport protein ExbB